MSDVAAQKSLRLTAVRLVDQITAKLISETNSLEVQKLNSALITVNISMTILHDDVLRARRLLSNARRLANVQEKEEG